MRTVVLIIFTLLLTTCARRNDSIKAVTDDTVHFETDGDNQNIVKINPRRSFPRYPILPAASKNLNDLSPLGWELLDSVYSDLNSDLTPDLAVVLQYKDTVNEVMPGNWEWENTPRILALFFKDNKSNEYKLQVQNNYIIPRAGTGKQGGDPFSGIKIDNNGITIDGMMGGKYTFKYLHNDFYLTNASITKIEAATNEYDKQGTYNYDTIRQYRLDFLRNEAYVEKTLMQQESKTRQLKYKLNKRPLISLKKLLELDELKLLKLINQE